MIFGEPTFDQRNADGIASSVQKWYAYVVEEELSFPTLPAALYESYIIKSYEAVGGSIGKSDGPVARKLLRSQLLSSTLPQLAHTTILSGEAAVVVDSWIFLS